MPQPYHAGLCAPHVRVPTLALISPHNDMPGANPRVARAVIESIQGQPKIVEIDGGHFGLVYYPSPEFESAVKEEAECLQAQL